jgi:hypothetical protein
VKKEVGVAKVFLKWEIHTNFLTTLPKIKLKREAKARCTFPGVIFDSEISFRKTKLYFTKTTPI